MIERDKLARALETWRSQLPPQIVYSLILAGETDPNIIAALTIHAPIERRDNDNPATVWCADDHEAWPCRTAYALGIRW